MRAEFTNSVNIKGLNEVIAATSVAVAAVAATVSVPSPILPCYAASSQQLALSIRHLCHRYRLHLCEWKMRVCM